MCPHALGRPTTLQHDFMPAIASQLTSTIIIQDMYTSSSATAIFIRGLAIPQTATGEPSCAPPPPDPSFSCVNGVWIGFDIVTTNTSIVISGPTVVYGTVIVPQNASIIFSPPANLSTSQPILNVFGCFMLDGSLNISISNATWPQLVSALNQSQLLLVESSCVMTPSTIPVAIVSQDVNGRVASASIDNVAIGTRFGLLETFQVDSSACASPSSSHTWWIVIIAVLGSVLVICAVVAIVYAVWRRKIYAT